ncbi:PREDICTED: uncharacterized protein LOC109360032 [Lupinus angustifolius]|uniref:uncharacterized protein LOC109360032 n=1 Tax=Lupinus angustifolius TaxID=3871 RepID=UPI00092F68D1|nr:PREDICTED: uncharacterized protein LOC109360032 [Lupinus angustifolius]
MGEKNQNKKNMQHKNAITNGVVIITVYVESLRKRSIKKTNNPNPRYKISKSYDRRAQLLAYSRELRKNALSEEKVEQQIPSNESLPRTKSKKPISLAERVQICFSTSRTQWMYECVEPKESNEMNRHKKRKGSGKICYSFVRKLKSLFKKLSRKEKFNGKED